jgi:membrane protein DedA with SNARE-associated domain
MVNDSAPHVDLDLGTPVAQRGTPPRWLGPVLLVIVVGLYIVGIATSGLATKLLKDHPLSLIALAPRYRWFILASPRIDVLPYFTVGIARLLASDPVYFALGWFFGDRAIRFFEDSLGKPTIDKTRELFLKASTVMALFFAGPIICVLAGAAGMKPKKFFTLNVIGTTLIVAALRIFSDQLDGVIKPVLRFNDRYSKYILIVTVAVSALYISRAVKKQVGAVRRFRR